MAKQRGFTYLGLLVAIALLGIGLLGASEVWVTTARLQRQAQLEWAGEQIRQAIGSYYEASPGPAKAFPRQLDDLLEDRRYVTVRRHLRQVYRNPLTRAADWELIKDGSGGIRGVRATASQNGEPTPMMREFTYTPARL